MSVNCCFVVNFLVSNNVLIRTLMCVTGVYYDYVSLCSRYSILDPYCSRGAIGRAVCVGGGVCGRCDLMILWFRHVIGFWCYGPVAYGTVVTEVVFCIFCCCLCAMSVCNVSRFLYLYPIR